MEASLFNTTTANGVIEATHKMVGQVIQTLVHLHPPTTKEQAKALVRRAIATVIHSHRCSSCVSLGGLSPGAAAFGRDMLLNLPLIIDVNLLHQFRQHRIDEALIRANSSRISHDYQVDEMVYKKVYPASSDKAKPIYKGPYKIKHVHTNNTVTIRIQDNVTDRLSIQLLKPALLYQRRPQQQ